MHFGFHKIEPFFKFMKLIKAFFCLHWIFFLKLIFQARETMFKFKLLNEQLCRIMHEEPIKDQHMNFLIRKKSIYIPKKIEFNT